MSDSAMPDEVLLVRADASATIGVGHVMRCFALAEAWLETGGRVAFAMNDVPEGIAQRIARTGARIFHVDAPEDAARVAREVGATHAVIDGYHLGVAHQEALAAAGTRLLVVDDAGETATRAAAMVLNQNAHASPALYDSLGSAPELLLGLTFALLRSEFRHASAKRAVPDVAQRLLVTFGGADTAQLAPRALEALAPLDGLDVLLVAGAANPSSSTLRAPTGARANVRVETEVDDMAEKMRWADLALIAAGSTSWELAASGVPMIAIVVADNQRGVGTAIGELGVGESLGAAADVSVTDIRAAVVRLAADLDARQRMARRGRQAVDGRGAQRVCAALRGRANAGGSGGAR